LLLTVAIPGVSKDDVQIDVQENTLTIRSERPEASGFPGFTPPAAVRTFQIPRGVKVGGIHAKLHEGLLTITMPPEEGREFSAIETAFLRNSATVQQSERDLEDRWMVAERTTLSDREKNEVGVTLLGEDASDSLMDDLSATLGVHSWMLDSVCTVPVQLTTEIALDAADMAGERPLRFRIPSIAGPAHDPASVGLLARFPSGTVQGLSADIAAEDDDFVITLWDAISLLDAGDPAAGTIGSGVNIYPVTVSVVGVRASIYG
jgi:hypothetical protein